MLSTTIQSEWVKMSKSLAPWLLIGVIGIGSLLIAGARMDSGSETAYFNGVKAIHVKSFIFSQSLIHYFCFWGIGLICIVQGQLEYRNKMNQAFQYFPVKTSHVIWSKFVIASLFLFLAAFTGIVVYGIQLYTKGLSPTQDATLFSYLDTLPLQAYLMLRLILSSLAAVAILTLLNIWIGNLIAVVSLCILLYATGLVFRWSWYPFSLPQLSSFLLLKSVKDPDQFNHIFAWKYMKYEYLSVLMCVLIILPATQARRYAALWKRAFSTVSNF